MKKNARGNTGMMVSHPGDNTSVKVLAHERRKPTRNAVGPARGLGQTVTDDLAENSKMTEMPSRQPDLIRSNAKPFIAWFQPRSRTELACRGSWSCDNQRISTFPAS